MDTDWKIGARLSMDNYVKHLHKDYMDNYVKHLHKDLDESLFSLGINSISSSDMEFIKKNLRCYILKSSIEVWAIAEIVLLRIERAAAPYYGHKFTQFIYKPRRT